MLNGKHDFDEANTAKHLGLYAKSILLYFFFYPLFSFRPYFVPTDWVLEQGSMNANWEDLIFDCFILSVDSAGSSAVSRLSCVPVDSAKILDKHR